MSELEFDDVLDDFFEEQDGEGAFDEAPPPPPPEEDPKKPTANGLPGLVKGKFGTDPTFELTAGNQTIDSPPLVWSETSSYMTFSYTIVETPVNFLMGYEFMCQLSEGKRETIFEEDIIINTTETGVTTRWCRMLFDYSEDPKCFSFFLRINVSMDEGQVDLTKFKFGPDSICLPKANRTKLTTSNCDFQSGDCDFKNDACGFTEWKVKESEESARRRKRDLLYFLRIRRSDVYSSGEPVPLTKETTTDTCDFQNICFSCLQSSGFTVSSSTAAGPERKRREDAYASALYLDPSDSTSGMAVGVFNTAYIIYHSANEILKFSYTFFSEGMHQIVVGVVCMMTGRSSTTYWIQLNEEENYYVNNFEISVYAQSGKICLNLHNYVGEDDCEEFAVQFIGAAAYSALVINSVGFYENVDSALCSYYDN